MTTRTLQIRHCDRCHAETPVRGVQAGEWTPMARIVLPTGAPADLCPACKASFEAWWAMSTEMPDTTIVALRTAVNEANAALCDTRGGLWRAIDEARRILGCTGATIEGTKP